MLKLWMCADVEGWHRKLASVSAPFVSLLAPQCGTANLTTWLADKQLIDYGTADRSLVYIVPFQAGLYLYFFKRSNINERSHLIITVNMCLYEMHGPKEDSCMLWEDFSLAVYKILSDNCLN